MVSSIVRSSTKPDMGLPPHRNILFSLDRVDTISSDHLEFDFSDVFGPVPIEANNLDLGVSLFDLEKTELLFDYSLGIHTKNHSLVGPTCLIQSLKLGAHTLTVGNPTELTECAYRKGIVEYHESSKDVSLVEDHEENVDFNSSLPQSIGIGDFEVMKVVGRGAFGKVFQVRMKGSGEIYAMKVIRKDKIAEKNHAEYMKAERDILTKIDHPFIVQLRYSFQSKYRLYLVLDFVNGGHLFFQLNRQGLFREDLARIYAAEIVCAVSHLHQNGIMHRDLKPENVLLDADGHAMLTDFGLAKQFEENTKSNSMCGTVEYMSPEVVCGKGHDKAADWWSVGILLFEMLTGKPPFFRGNNAKIQQQILKDKIKLPAFLTSEAHSLLKALLQKDASKRLGSGAKGSEEIKGHKWFKDIKWKNLENREIVPSFQPQVAGKQCVSNFEKRWTEMSLCDSPASTPTFRNNPDIFNDFAYVKPKKNLA